jgi:HemY protein
VLRDAWKSTPHPDIAAMALAPFADAGQRHREATKLVRENPSHPESLFLLATHALAAGTADTITEARRLAEEARNGGLNHQRLFRLLADIDAADMTGGTLLKPREALRQASAAEPDPGWRCESCGTPQPSWLPVCPSCNTPGRVSWGTSYRPKLISAPSIEL